MSRTPAELRAAADILAERVLLALRKGWHVRATELAAEAVLLREEAAAMERGLRDGKRSVNVHTDVTSTQLARRGRAIAASKADNALKLAITQDSRWGSLRVYAKRRLKISPGSLTAYMQDRPCPAAIDRKIREDFPDLVWNWPKGLTD